jgi:hypothetical protein
MLGRKWGTCGEREVMVHKFRNKEVRREGPLETGFPCWEGRSWAGSEESRRHGLVDSNVD